MRGNPKALRLTRNRTAAIEPLEPRWNPSWGSIPPGWVSPPTSALAVTLNWANDAYGSAAITNNEVDYYSFTPKTTGSYRLAASSDAVDTVLAVYNSTGSRVAYNDDVVPDYDSNSQRFVTLYAGTQYYLGITNYSGTSGGGYTWAIDGPSSVDDKFEQNDSLAGASDLGAINYQRTVSGLVMNDRHDWFKFTINRTGGSGDYAGISFIHAHGDLDFELYNAAGSRLARSEGTADSERISLSGRAAATYYVHIYGYQGANNPNYALTIQAPDPPAPGPDLQGALLNATDSSPWGQAINVQYAVRNAGNEDAGAFQTQWWLSRDTTWSSDDIILTDLSGVPTRTIWTLPAGVTSTTRSVTLALPPASYVSDWSGSSFYIVMRTDTANQVTESNESNNSGQIGSGHDYDPITIGDMSTGQFQITLNISGMTTAQRDIFQQAAVRWEQVITGDIPNTTYNGRAVDDLLIDASGQSIDGVGGVLGQSGPDAFRSGSDFPIHAVMEFDTADMADMQANGTLLGVIEHEIGHALGIGTIWRDLGLLQGAGTSNPMFMGPRATAEYNRIFGTSAAGVPVENGGGSGTRDSHWRESILQNELMTGYVDSNMSLSRITVASLADLGYQVNMNAADAYQRPASVSSASAAATTTSSSSPSLRGVDAMFAAYDALWQNDQQRSHRDKGSKISAAFNWT